MPKVLLINGSPRKGGNTFRALTEMANTLQTDGFDTEIVWIGNKAVRGCIACFGCGAKKDGKCVFDDDVTNEIGMKANDADAFVCGSPVYFGQPSGQLMCLVQRLLICNRQAFAGKPVANVAICRRGGATMAFQTMNMPWMMVNSPIVTSQYWNVAYGQTPGEVACDAEGLQTLRTTAHNIVRMVKALALVPTPEREAGIATNFIRQDLK